MITPKDKQLAILSYAWILCLLVYFSKSNTKENEFLRNHIKHSVLFFVISIPILAIDLVTMYGVLALFVLALIGAISAHFERKYPINLVPDKWLIKTFRTDQPLKSTKDLFSFDEQKSSQEKDDQSRFLASLSYVWIISIVINSLYQDKSSFVKYHSEHGMRLFFLSLLILIIPGIREYSIVLIIILSVIGFLIAFQGEKLPKLNILDENIKNFAEDVEKTLDKGFTYLTRSKDRKLSDFEYQNIMICYLFMGPLFLIPKLNENNTKIILHAKQSTLLIFIFIISYLNWPGNIGYFIGILAISLLLRGLLLAFQNKEMVLFNRN